MKRWQTYLNMAKKMCDICKDNEAIYIDCKNCDLVNTNYYICIDCHYDNCIEINYQIQESKNKLGVKNEWEGIREEIRKSQMG